MIVYSQKYNNVKVYSRSEGAARVILNNFYSSLSEMLQQLNWMPLGDTLFTEQLFLFLSLFLTCHPTLESFKYAYLREYFHSALQ